jgi:imidazole glycerol phosphate synthase subunit HisF
LNPVAHVSGSGGLRHFIDKVMNADAYSVATAAFFFASPLQLRVVCPRLSNPTLKKRISALSKLLSAKKTQRSTF